MNCYQSTMKVYVKKALNISLAYLAGNIIFENTYLHVKIYS